MGTEDSEVQKARRGVSTEKQGSSELWVVEFSCMCCLLKGVLFPLHFSHGVGSIHGWSSQCPTVGFEQPGLTVGLVSIIYKTGKNWEPRDQLGQDGWSPSAAYFLEPGQLFL